MKKKVVKLTGKDVKNMVDRIIKEDMDNRQPIRRTTGPGEHERFAKYGKGTRWSPAMTRDPQGKQLYDKYVETYGPFTIYMSADRSIKIAENGGRFYTQDDRMVSREEAEELLGYPLSSIGEEGLIPEGRQPKRKRVVRLTESEMIEFLDKLATRVENTKKRRGIK